MILKCVRWFQIGVITLSAMSVQAADITITVNGRVVARPCTVSTTSANVDLGDLTTLSFSSPGSVSAWHSIELNLSNCPEGTNQVVATFNGTADSTGFYQNQGTANNIQLELKDSNSNATLNNGATMSVQVEENSQSARFPLEVRALSVNGGATQGSIQAVINVTYTYA